MRRYRSLPILAVRRMRGSWRLLSSVAIGSAVAAAVLSATAIYSDAIRDLGLDFALSQQAPETLDVSIRRSNISVRARDYERSQARIQAAVAEALGPAAGVVVRQGTSATFYPTAPGVPVDTDNADRPRANLRFRDDIEDQLQIVAGRTLTPLAAGDSGSLPAVLGAATAARNGIAVGDLLELHPFWDVDATPLTVEVVGLAAAADPLDRYWGGDEYAVEAPRRRWETLILLVPESTFFGAIPERLPTTTATYTERFEVEPDALNARVAAGVADRLEALETRLAASEQRARVDTVLVEVLRSYDEKLFFTRIPLFVLLLQIGGIVAYYLVVVSTMLVERHGTEIATLRSRGASTGQLLTQFGIEGLILAALAVAAGPPIAAAVIAALGPTPAFSALSGGGTLDVHISTLSYLLAAGGALLAFAAFLFPAWRATRSTAVEFRRAAARPRPTPLLLRYYLDVALVLVLAAVFWRLSQQDELFTESIFGERRADPFLLSAPAVFMVTVGAVFLRLFPLGLRVVALLVAQTRSVALLTSIRSLVRNPMHYARLILLLMFATGVGMFGATFSATLERSYEDRAAYAVGADVRAADMRALDAPGAVEFRAAMAAVPAQASSAMLRVSGTIEANGVSERVQLLGVEPASFGRVSYFRGDFADASLPELLATLEANAAEPGGIVLPAGARQVGAWLRLPEIRARVSVAMSLRDARGETVSVLLGSVRPGDAATAEWRFFAADLRSPLNLRGRPAGRPLAEPITLHAVFLDTRSGIAAERGSARFGAVLATAEAPPGRPGILGDLGGTALAFPGAELVYDFAQPDFTQPGFAVVQGYRSEPLSDSVRVAADAPPGFAAALRYDWLDARLRPRRRGLGLPGDGQPVAFYLSREAAGRLGLSPGDAAQLAVGSRFVAGEFAGALDLFPTFEVDRALDAFAIVNASRLMANVGAALPLAPLRLNEAWFASTDPASTLAALEAFAPQLLLDREAELLRQEEDPLVAAGWSGILAISFGAVLLLATIGFLVYSYLTARQRGLEFAILRTLGFSQLQVFLVVVIEHLFIVAAGIGLGTLVGLQVGSLMMDFLGTTERGVEVLPPFQLRVSWTQVLVVWAVLGAVLIATVATVVLLYLRLAVHRALRIADA